MQSLCQKRKFSQDRWYCDGVPASQNCASLEVDVAMRIIRREYRLSVLPELVACGPGTTYRGLSDMQMHGNSDCRSLKPGKLRIRRYLLKSGLCASPRDK